MSIAIYEEFQAIPMQSIAATAKDSEDIHALGAKGIICFMRVKSVTTGTADLAISFKESFQANYSRINLAVTTSAIGNNIYILYPGAAEQPPGAAADTISASVKQIVSIPLVSIFRLSIVKSDTSAWEVGVACRRLR